MKSIFNVAACCLVLSTIFIGCDQADKQKSSSIHNETSKNKPIVEKITEEKVLGENELKVILGTYTSNEAFLVDYADNSMDGGPRCTLEIKKGKRELLLRNIIMVMNLMVVQVLIRKQKLILLRQ